MRVTCVDPKKQDFWCMKDPEDGWTRAIKSDSCVLSECHVLLQKLCVPKTPSLINFSEWFSARIWIQLNELSVVKCTNWFPRDNWVQQKVRKSGVIPQSCEFVAQDVPDVIRKKTHFHCYCSMQFEVPPNRRGVTQHPKVLNFILIKRIFGHLKKNELIIESETCQGQTPAS